jgi:hypothetical protein
MDALIAAIESGRRGRSRRVRVAAVVACALAAAIVTLGRDSTGDATVTTRVIERPVVQRVVEPAAAEMSASDVPTPTDDEAELVATARSGDDAPPPEVEPPARPPHRSAAVAPTELADIWRAPAAIASGSAASSPFAAGTGQASSGPAPGDCDDGALRRCAAMPPVCPPATLLAIQSGCWTCADPHTCAPLGVPRTCDDSRLTCQAARPTCSGREVVSVRGGCWRCVDPFTCGSPGGSLPPRPPPQPPPHRQPQPNGGTCGDGMCEHGEDHVSCPADCCQVNGSGSGGCVAICDNGFCEVGEDHASCPADCCELGANGACVSVCGNGVCEAGEDATTCAADCH